jgi:hypothetical protein
LYLIVIAGNLLSEARAEATAAKAAAAAAAAALQQAKVWQVSLAMFAFV